MSSALISTPFEIIAEAELRFEAGDTPVELKVCSVIGPTFAVSVQK
jgi:hypothetical protein